ncbi:diacylglycerol beta-glycosyltransferase [Mycoplasmoides pneumoniae]|uniref:diacylglycerol beta-glycosyltransferase n=1 Tax=Mycoplasmoides pneumoniae TaxID=2104 RepID=UPI0006A6B761|nr:diacylglycerol beta-glycosyltransferase [Mycoplasmoides pneumoniae]ALA31747.1 glycosyl transferase family A [Mycoplasmoides pneumoniae 39443]ALA38098.1 glycosyl transferase family A [Mycoplasmoides pneumoniae M2592]ARQ38878.1 glycosyl transferase family A [Mycoplasmoides pneumoniae]ARQ39586.1 glycosyl transferase family A [Mycoplasmoides pneumoniae]ARQ40998.1 glycosyl transferase family A [Mycoplasmoides pneumoniae]
MNKLISILVPCYQSQPFLDRFFKSLLKQDWNGVKVIFFNDNKPDPTYEILKQFQQAHPQLAIEVHCGEKNVGVGGSRDQLINYVDTPYFYFVDPDDEFSDPNCFKAIVETIQGENFDIAVLNSIVYLQMLKNDFLIKHIPLKNIFQGKVKLNPDNTVNHLHYIQNNDQYIWNIVINTAFFKALDLQFVNRFIEDIAVWFPIMFKAQKVLWIDVNGVNYYLRPNSASTQKNSIKLLSFIEAYERLYFHLKKVGKLADFIDPNNKIESRFWRRQAFIWFSFINVSWMKAEFEQTKSVLQKLFDFMEAKGIYDRVFTNKHHGIYLLWVNRLKHFKKLVQAQPHL